jgi:heavy metal-binding protein
MLSRRTCLGLLAGAPLINAWQKLDAPPPGDWTCPMDPDYHSDNPGVCPRCGMKLVMKVPDRIEYPLELAHFPEILRPGETAKLKFRVLDPSGRPVHRFETVHEKLIHLFVVSENLDFFAHVHPVFQPDGSFDLEIRLPYGGMYRMLADYYPQGSVPQLAIQTLYVAGKSGPAHLAEAIAPQKETNLDAALRIDPSPVLAGFETKLFYDLSPAEGLEPYLGAWGHMLAVSEDLIDMMHQHPFLVTGSTVQFNVIFPRPGLYKIWTQFQRQSTVNTVVFTVSVRAL